MRSQDWLLARVLPSIAAGLCDLNVWGLAQIDKDGANPERAKTQLSEADLMPEEWGGSTPMVEVSHPFFSSTSPEHCDG